MRLPGFIGPSYTTRSTNFDAQRCVNWYPELNEIGSGKEKEIAALVPTPGLISILADGVGEGPIRCIHVDEASGKILVISKNKCYVLSKSGSTWSATLIEDAGVAANSHMTTNSGIVRAESTSEVTVFTDGTDNCYFQAGTPDDFFTFDAKGYTGVPTSTHIAYIDGYLIMHAPATNTFSVNRPDDAFYVFFLADFASAEGDTDPIVAQLANRRDLWLFGTRSIEVWANNGNADFPFERIQGGFIETGILAVQSLARTGGANSTIFWLGKDKIGQGIVYSANGFTPQRISNFALENAIKGYASPSAATAFCYQDGGHTFYQLNFAEATWVFDLSTAQWHERAYTNSGALERHRADVHCYVPSLGIHLVGDYTTNKVYQLDNDTYTDASNVITRIRTSPHMSSGLDRIFCSSFQLDMESGVGLDGAVQGSDPQIILDWSDDGGHTWSNEHFKSIGKIGEKSKRVKWDRLGAFRDRIWRVKLTDPVKAILLGAEIKVEGGG